MQTHFEMELANLKEKLLTMGSYAEAAVSQSVKALIDRDDALARSVCDKDDIMDGYEVEVDELSIRLLAKAPLASDLRLITVAMKISQNLERVGDEATTIARRALELNKAPSLKAYVDLPRMASISLEILKSALDAFVDKHPEQALLIIPRDKTVDELNRQMHRELYSHMMENPENIMRCLHHMVVCKCLERIADHATNIAEEVVYLYQAKDVRHAGVQS